MSAIQKGKNCVVQCRVSSTKQSSEGESLEVQESVIRHFIGNKEWDIVPNGKVWSTAISGRKTGRADFEEILAYIKANPGLVDYYVFRSIDRATRAGNGEYERMKSELAQYGVSMLDTNGIIQPSKNTLEDVGMEYDWSRSFPSEITESVMATTAKQEVTNILTRMIGQEIRLTQQGYRARRPSDGYINNKIYVGGKKKTIQVPDPERAKYRIAMFDLRARGLSDLEIVTKVNAMGYRSPLQNRWNKEHSKIIGKKGGTPLTIKQLQRDIQNPIYAGIICEKWTHYKPIKAQYDGLVSIEQWNRANKGKIAIMCAPDGTLELVRPTDKVESTRNRNNPLFPYKFLSCPFCEKPFTASAPRGKSGKQHPTYHCSRKQHKYYGINKETFEANVEKYIRSLKFKPELLGGLEATFLNKYREREIEIVKASGFIHQNIADLETEQAAKLEAYSAPSSGSVIREMLAKEIDGLEVRIKNARKERLKIQITRDDIKAFIREAKKIMEHPAEMLLKPTDIQAQRELFELVFEKIPNYAEILNGTPKLSFIFALSSEFVPSENQLVTPRGIEPRFTP